MTYCQLCKNGSISYRHFLNTVNLIVTKVKQRGSTSLQIEICNAAVKMAAPPRVTITITLQNKSNRIQ